MTLTKKEASEKKRIDRKVFGGKYVTRKEILRAFELRAKLRVSK